MELLVYIRPLIEMSLLTEGCGALQYCRIGKKANMLNHNSCDQ